MIIVYLAAMLGLIQICEYSTDNDKYKKFLAFLKIAIVFTSVGFQLGKAII